MKEKTQYEALVEELQKIVENFKVGFTEIGEILSKILPDVEIPDEEEDTWEMKCPYEEGDEYYFVSANGLAKYDSWDNYDFEKRAFAQGNIFKTQQEAELEAKRRNLLTRFKAFRDECNGDWKAEWTNSFESKHYLEIIDSKVVLDSVSYANRIATFGYFKNEEDAERAIELFGDEIKALFVDC